MSACKLWPVETFVWPWVLVVCVSQSVCDVPARWAPGPALVISLPTCPCRLPPLSVLSPPTVCPVSPHLPVPSPPTALATVQAARFPLTAPLRARPLRVRGGRPSSSVG